MSLEHFDVLIVGAGLSGIGAGYHLQTRCPGKTYAILEARERLGGTWDLFRYPGIRSDSDMYTLGYSFRPWTQREGHRRRAVDPRRTCARRPRRTASTARSATATASSARVVDRGRPVDRRGARGRHRRDACASRAASSSCARLLRLRRGLHARAPGHASGSAAAIVHPQQWTADLDYEGKRVVVIGSGATAVTLVPELAETAAHVTMLQRSPTYVVSVARRATAIADWLREHAPAEASPTRSRAGRTSCSAWPSTSYCRRYPERAKTLLVGLVQSSCRPATTSTRTSRPRTTRGTSACASCPTGTCSRRSATGRASVVTDHIDTFTETGPAPESGAELEADLIVTATGLKLQFLGGMEIEVDGQRVEPSRDDEPTRA